MSTEPVARKPLPESFTYLNDEFLQLAREGRAAIYSRTSPTGRVWFEVIIVQGHDGREVHGAWAEPAEFYPGTNSWGALGWTYNERSRHLADEKFNQLCIRFGTRKSTPVRRRAPLPLRVPGGKHVTYPPTDIVQLQSIAKDDETQGPRIAVDGPRMIECDFSAGAACPSIDGAQLQSRQSSCDIEDEALALRVTNYLNTRDMGTVRFSCAGGIITAANMGNNELSAWVGEAVALFDRNQDTGADPLGDGKFKMYPSGDIVDLSERNARLARFAQSPKPLNCQEQAWETQQARQRKRLPHDERGWKPD